MRRLAAIVVAGIGGLHAAAAIAADMPRRMQPVIELPEPPYWPIRYGWYLRGDMAYRWHMLNHVEISTGVAPPTGNTLQSGWAAGIGAGFKYDWLRVDATVDYGSQFNYTGSLAAPGDTSAKLRAATGLVNFYYEPYTWRRLTPYVGAGIGAAYLTASDYVSPAGPIASPATHKWNVAYALMAGTSFAVSRQFQIDFGYRYLFLGSVDTGPDALGRRLSFKEVAAHELRLGVRFMFPDPPHFR
jgi:opacity protein-like surface antigen